MAGEMPPPMPPAGEFSAEDYEFDALDELESGNALLDEVLTRAGELALDTIEFVQEHPVLSGALVAASFGAFVGLVVAALQPQRRPSAQEQAAAAAAEASARAAEALAGARLGARLADAQEVVGGRLSGARGRLGRAAEAAQERVREANVLENLGTISGRARDRARESAEDLAAAARRDGGSGLADSVAGQARRAGYAAQLLPLSLALLRNPLVRDLLAQILVNRLRRTARL
ncbi:MAG TPA: hypothetical protein VII06_17555 [Chloroflexota bacterium]